MKRTEKIAILLAAIVVAAAVRTNGAVPNGVNASAARSAENEAAVGMKPISAALRKAFGAVRPDPHPEKLTRDSHYWISDEKRHDLFRAAIENKGGVFIGLGTDQNYLMAGWARPEILVPLDFDQMVVNLHYVFRVVFLNAKTPNDFIEMWSEDGFVRTRDLVKDAYVDRDPKFQKGVLHAFKKARRLVYPRLRRVRRSAKKFDTPNYLTDSAQYLYLVRMFRTDRVFPVRGDLTASNTVRDVAEAAKDTGLRISTLYLSNAEQYFKYSKDFKENMLALPLDEKSVVIRTVGKRTPWAADGLYEYVVQSGENFRVWLEHPKTYTVWPMVNARKVNKKTGGSVIVRLPKKADK